MTKDELIAVCAKYGYSAEWVERFLAAKPPEIKLEEITRQDLELALKLEEMALLELALKLDKSNGD